MEFFSVEQVKRPVRRRRQFHHLRLQSWRLCETVSALFAVAGWAVATLDYELSYSSLRSENNCMQTHTGHTLRWIDLMLSTAALVFLGLRHQAKYLWSIHKFGVKGVLGTLGRLGLEAFLLCLFPYPYVEGEVYVDERHIRPSSYTFKRHDVCYTGSEVLYAFMFLRFFFILRAFVNMSPYMDGHAKQACKQYGVKANMRFTLRALAQARPMTLLIVLALPTALLASQLIRLFERPYVPFCLKDFSDYANSVYFTFVAMTTIAFGDFYPCTQLGRYISIVIEVWGMGLFSMMIYIINRTIQIARPEESAFRALRRTRLAAQLIEAWYLLHKQHRGEWTALARRQEKYRQGNARLLTGRTGKEGKRKEVEATLEAMKQAFTRIEVRVGAVDSLCTQLQGALQLLQCLDAPSTCAQL